MRRRHARTLSGAGIALLLLATAVLAGPFHPDGDGKCGCHVLHKSEDGWPVISGTKLVRGRSSTDLCLSCHAVSNGSVLVPNPTQPSPEIGAGNFTFLLEDNINDRSQGSQVIRGNHAGHNVISAYYGILEDPDHSISPGGTYPSSELGCISCHDPHDAEGNYRMLRGAGPVGDGSFTFNFAAPQAEGIPLSGREDETSHTAYQGGWSRWCANCHGLYHESLLRGFEHPVEVPFDTAQRDSYNGYRGESDPNGGDQSSAYLPEVPFEDPSMTTSSRSGPGLSARVSCISCHRAHGTSAPEANRWDKTVLYLNDDGVRSGSWPIPNPYPGPQQRSLCIKCHVEKTRSHGTSQPCLQCHSQGPH